eukprot:COSAG05_NODE_2386_length_3133_cov_3.531869_2_plen_79_part_00
MCIGAQRQWLLQILQQQYQIRSDPELNGPNFCRVIVLDDAGEEEDSEAAAESEKAGTCTRARVASVGKLRLGHLQLSS